MEGYRKVRPVIKGISFPVRGKIAINLKDGRVIWAPLNSFPSIKALNSNQRKKWYIFDGEGFSFDECDEVYHIEQVLGSYNDYKYSFV
jgi:hypothetical protein